MPESGSREAGAGGSDAGGPRSRAPDQGVLVIQTAFLGDVVLTTGLLDLLAQRGAPVDVVTTPAALPLLETHPGVRRVIAFDKRGADRGIGGMLRLASRLRGAGYAKAYLPHRSLRSAMLARLAGIPARIGFAKGPGAWSYTRRIPRPPAGHEAERILSLAEPERGARARVALGITDADRREAVDWLLRHGVPDGFVAMAPGSIWGTKRWPGYADLARALDRSVVIVGGAEDRALGDAIGRAAPGRVHLAAGELPLRVSAALLEHAAVLVTNDSAPLHLASAVGTRVVAIFGPTVPAFGFGPRGERDQVVEVPGLTCRPCSSHGPAVCPLGHHRCMRELSVSRVLEAVEEVIGR